MISKLTAGKGRSNGEKSKPDKEKEKKKGKESVGQTVVSVEQKGENEFVVLTVRQTTLIKSRTTPIHYSFVRRPSRFHS